MKFDRIIRQFVPSISKLTYNPLFKFLVDVADFPLSMAFSETRNLPPNHTRLRVGVRNRILNNQIFYLRSATNFWIDAALNRYTLQTRQFLISELAAADTHTFYGTLNIATCHSLVNTLA